MEVGFYWLLIFGLATFRLAVMFSRESGPYRVFSKLRNIPPPKSATKEGLSCPLCLSVWFGAFIVGLSLFKWPWYEVSLHMLAASAIGVIIHLQWTKKAL